MQVFKFGGASVKDASGVRNITQIILQEATKQLVVVISAMGKVTDALEELTWSYLKQQADVSKKWQAIRAYHEQIMRDLVGEASYKTHFASVFESFAAVEAFLANGPDSNANQVYDQIVSYGELISTQLVSAYLNYQGSDAIWVDARRLIRTDDAYREAGVRWETTCENITNTLLDLLSTNVIITQGFIGATSHGFTTTLGRDGSDYSAAIFAYCINAKRVTIWKDVPGVLNADPRWFDETVRIDKMTYLDAIELAYYGANVIHPKTIKPLQNKNIQLYVRSFINPQEPGTAIGPFTQHLQVPSFIFKINQILISLHPKDFSFIAEENLSRIFGVFAETGVAINLMQNSAISFSIVTNNEPEKINRLLTRLSEDFQLTYNDNLELITIRYYDQNTIDRVLINKRLLLEQKSRYTVQLVVKEN
ncbi:aspartate kinase [Tellurirhabdus bombi]|uniref:aspartate kinase n=1 Tax=Tellurirhabdus bombi TaxID=2907205 RepID=UPI001F3B4930|nr:aspartate kinase [Tellurirhabdus bombi]